jgi:hypothetical protein
MGVGGQRHAPAALPPGEWLGTNSIGGWVGPRAGLVGCENPAPSGFDPRTVQLVARRYTDWAITPLRLLLLLLLLLSSFSFISHL